MFFDTWDEVGRIALTGLLYYLFIILAVRLAGKRSTSKMNNFDWIVTVAIGSIAGSTILLKDVSLINGLAGTGVLLVLQYVSTKASVHSKAIGQLLRASPTLLVYQGDYLHQTMQRERVTAAEIRAAVREQGIADLDQVWAVILESDAEMSVIRNPDAGQAPILKDVEGVPGRKGA